MKARRLVFQRIALLPLLLVCASAVPVVMCAGKLQSYGVDMNHTTVSGLSAGAFFAVQFQVAFSNDVIASGIVAGGPYYCSEGTLAGATVNCMTTPALISVPSLAAKARSMGDIDSLYNLQRAKVFLYSGKIDTVVRQGVMEKALEWFEVFVPKANIRWEFSIASEHSWVTMDYGNTCLHLGSPYINKCEYPLAANIMEWLVGVNKTADIILSNLLTFDQREFIKGESMDSTGYVYVPTNCQREGVECRLHVSFHGCKQGRELVDDAYPMHTGLLPIAEANDIVVLFPQVKQSMLLPYNPNGCFDWWGYAGSNYATRSGAQMAAVYEMMRRLAGPQFETRVPLQ